MAKTAPTEDMARSRASRYELAKARDLGQRGEATAHAVRAGNIKTGIAAVADPRRGPDDPPDQRVLATVNRRVDILEHELAHGRISSAAYAEGRVLQALFERGGLSGGSTWSDGSRVDAEVAKELAIIRRIGDARAIEARLREAKSILGSLDLAIVRQVLGENRTYAQVRQTTDLINVAALAGANDWLPAGKGGKRAPSRGEVSARRVTYLAQRFRDALETLARESGRGERR
jgi:hypothetical protein